MKNTFVDILREPDSILFQFEDSTIRFEEPDSREEQNARIDYTISNGEGIITLYPSERPVRRIKLRWRADLSEVISVLGDTFERLYDIAFGANHAPAWRSICPEICLPWYFHTYDGESLHCYGVKTGADAFCHFQVDESGITLWLDVRNGGGGVRLTAPLVCARVVSRRGVMGEDPFLAARTFCKIMCEKPNLPKSPIYGVNNWYWAYGNTSHEGVREETVNLMDMCADAKGSPYMIIDDGWQASRYLKADRDSYNGGPWELSNPDRFSSMQETADMIHSYGAKSGIWFRPLLTAKQVPAEWESQLLKSKHGILLDPSHPEVLTDITNNVKMISGWGYDLIKYDFTTFDTIDLFGKLPDDNRHFYNKTLTNATILKNMYNAIQAAAGESVILGCSAINHLAAGIHQAMRVSHDTSGRSFEITRISGPASMLRLPQNNIFYASDPDCAAFTSRVPIGANLDYLEECAITGMVTLASVTPGILKGADLARIRGIYKIASEGGSDAVPTDWLMHNNPSHFIDRDNKRYDYDWYKVYDGVRSHYTWMN